jgi:hypothetical protein
LGWGEGRIPAAGPLGGGFGGSGGPKTRKMAISQEDRGFQAISLTRVGAILIRFGRILGRIGPILVWFGSILIRIGRILVMFPGGRVWFAAGPVR